MPTDELKQTPHTKPKDNLTEILFIFSDIAKEEAERSRLVIPPMFVAFHLERIENRCRLYQHGYSLVLTARPCADPMTLELIKTIGQESLSRISNVEPLALTDFIEHNEVILIPMQDAGKWGKRQIIHGCPYTDRMKPNLVCGLTDSQHGDTF